MLPQEDSISKDEMHLSSAEMKKKKNHIIYVGLLIIYL